MTEEITILGALLLVAITVLGAFIKSYISKKAENLANKNDLIDLNTKIEKIKSQNAATLSLVNANLNLASKGLETFESEQFKTYIAFHQECSSMLDQTVQYFPNEITYFSVNYKDLQAHIKNIEDSQKTLRIAKANYDLFTDNEDLRTKGNDLYNICYLYSETLSLHMGRICVLKSTHDNLNEYLNSEKPEANPRIPERLTIQKLAFESVKDINNTTKALFAYVHGDNYKKGKVVLQDYEILLRQHLKNDRLSKLANKNITDLI